MKIMSSIKKILIIQTAFIGDAILATAFAASTKASFPNADVDFLLRKGNEDILNENGQIKNILIWDKKKKWKSLFSLLKSVRKKKYDLLFLLQRFHTMAFFSFLSCAKITIGFDSSPLSILFSKRIPHIISRYGKEHEIKRNLKLLQHIDANAKLKNPFLSLAQINLPEAKETYITIAPSSVWATKQFPIEKWIEFIANISIKEKIYLLGGPSDHGFLNRIYESFPKHNIYILAGKLSLRESAFLMKSAKMNFVNDSAPLHLASAVNAPVTAIFCSTVPEFGFGPLSDRGIVVQVDKEMDCRPCGIHGYKSCPKGHFNCAYDIPVTRLVEKI
jgi:ADP-heptose:LPS heptosyltransferase